MMTTKLSYGVRYGRKVRGKLSKFLDIKNKDKKCPYCHALKVRRIASGIWECTKCNSKFTGKAYDIGKTKIKESVKEDSEE
ncbi:50S ribosomal protein L37ae [Candidatus Woesearchaeota archaeon]|nr:50S ribosomal protein L37ae [Candidatus Woesearchaeota archaeon]MBT4368004.1 50S ribosomal protein L37ae [Candidatus Woesearchaeota archaeon]MBT4712492.1 50S ribosomal protein L37ae [Candidatus Woesearchaeota archaeon]MBT6639405.1 50S ribosomal protein L37ae [Candidatus Woesearchaeota archaeon]MBT7133577.1 50S ribosomal protein L37ae [Candidatus Woesearchaeota archaeon]